MKKLVAFSLSPALPIFLSNFHKATLSPLVTVSTSEPQASCPAHQELSCSLPFPVFPFLFKPTHSLLSWTISYYLTSASFCCLYYFIAAIISALCVLSHSIPRKLLWSRYVLFLFSFYSKVAVSATGHHIFSWLYTKIRKQMQLEHHEIASHSSGF
jgi:hypothetical protein